MVVIQLEAALEKLPSAAFLSIIKLKMNLSIL